MVTVIIVLTFFTVGCSSTSNDVLTVTFLDVGQGDAILIETPQGINILIDGGKPGGGVVRALSQALSWHERTIDLMVLTHPDDDHGGGLVEVARRYNVRQFAYTGVVHDAPSYVALLAEVEQQHIPITTIDRPQIIALGGGIVLEVLYPLTSVAGAAVESPNATSIATRLVYGEVEFLLTGDLEIEQELALIASGQKLPADVLKAGHHGSDTSNAGVFLEAVSPDHVVISAGADNDYGHPSLRVLRRLERAGARVWRTDEQGSIEVRTDGKRLEIRSEL